MLADGADKTRIGEDRRPGFGTQPFPGRRNRGRLSNSRCDTRSPCPVPVLGSGRDADGGLLKTLKAGTAGIFTISKLAPNTRFETLSDRSPREDVERFWDHTSVARTHPPVPSNISSPAAFATRGPRGVAEIEVEVRFIVELTVEARIQCVVISFMKTLRVSIERTMSWPCGPRALGQSPERTHQ